MHRHARLDDGAPDLHPPEFVAAGGAHLQHRQVHELHVPERDLGVPQELLSDTRLRTGAAEEGGGQLLQEVRHARGVQDPVQLRGGRVRGEYRCC